MQLRQGKTALFCVTNWMVVALLLLSCGIPSIGLAADHLSGTAALTADPPQIADWFGFLSRKLDESIERRAAHWHRDFSSAEQYQSSIAPNRARLAHIIGVRDSRVPFDAPELIATVNQPALVGRGAGFEAFAVRWPVFDDLSGEGLLLVPCGQQPTADVVAIPDATQRPEQLAGLSDGIPPSSQFARRLAESGCRVLVPTIIDREVKLRGREGWRGYSRNNMSNREYLFRPSYVLGRHLIGYEVQKVLAAVDWFKKDRLQNKVGVIGWGDGGMLALYAGAADPRIDAVCVSGYFTSRQQLWQEPFDRSVFGLLDQFGDAELATLVAPRKFIVEAARGPEGEVPSPGGISGHLVTPPLVSVREEVERSRQLVAGLKPDDWLTLTESGDGTGPFADEKTLSQLLDSLMPGAKLAAQGVSPQRLQATFDPQGRAARQLHEIERHNAKLLVESENVRRQFMSKLDTSSVEKLKATSPWYRDFFRNEVMGHFEDSLAETRPRTRKIRESETWVAYEVVLDVYEGTFVYGYLLVPKGIKPGETRPAVVCQHGGGGSPEKVAFNQQDIYHAMGAKLAEQGFIVFAPHVPFPAPPGDCSVRICSLLGKTQYSYIAPMHQQIVRFLQSRPEVDGQRIALYGLSWGGKVAMRIPLLCDGYALVICSGDFNEWIGKNASTDSEYSYVFQPEPHIFEFDLGSTFSYAEMAALIAPRPFMVERGHFDFVGSNEAVAYEFAKVRHLYEAKLRIPDRCGVDWFVGSHEINLHGALAFLCKHFHHPPTNQLRAANP